MTQDFYAALGVEANATPQEVKRAYRELARKYHPDKNPGDAAAEARFKEAAEAYRVLGDADLRAQYDAHLAGSGGGAPAPSREDAGDVFHEIFGTRPRGAQARPRGGEAPREQAPPRGRGGRERARGPAERGNDLRYTLELDFVEAARGVEKRIYLPRSERCVDCGGTGARPGSAPLLCQRCGGSGTVRAQQGFFDVSETCGKCRGTGRLIPQNCEGCGGSGEQRVQAPITVSVPPGVDGGTRLKVAGEGDPGSNGGERGDLFVVVQIAPHPLFSRDGQDVLTEVPITVTQAVLGAYIEIPTLEGRMRMRVPPGTTTGKIFRLKGKGVSDLGGRARGDQQVKVVVESPERLSPEQQELYARLLELEESGQGEEPERVREYRRRLKELLD